MLSKWRFQLTTAFSLFRYVLLLYLGLGGLSHNSYAQDATVVGWYPLNEGGGTLAGDVSGRGNDGTLINGALFEANAGDGSAYAVRLDGANDYIDLGALDVNGSGLTLAAWFNADSFPGPSSDPRIVSKASGVAANDHVFMLGTIKVGGAVRLRARVRVTDVTTTLIASSGDLLAGQWRHAAVTYDGVALRLYLDGVEVGSTALSGAVDQDPSLPVAVGAQPSGAGVRFFDGLLDDIRILERALTPTELATIVSGAPQAVDDSYQTLPDTDLIVNTAGGVLANDSGSGPLQAVLESDVANGTLTLNLDGSFTYIPDTGFSGSDSFTYRAGNGSVFSDPATVMLSVTASGGNEAPVASDDSYQTSADTDLIVDATSGVLANDTDPDQDPLQAELVEDVSSGTLTLNPDGSFTYIPDPGFSGTDSFTYRAGDGTVFSDPATVMLSVTASGGNGALVTLPLNEGSGTVANDASGQDNDGTLVNGALFEANTGDGSPFAVRFDGTNEYIDLGALDVNGNGLTLAAWFNAETFPGSSDDPRIISKASGVAANEHVFMLGTIKVGSAVRLRARVRVAGVTTTLIASSGDLSTGVWRHAAVTYDGASLRLHLDGVEVGSTALTGAVDQDPSLPVAVGAQPSGAGVRFFDGLLDDIRILERALTPTELATIVSGAPQAVDDSYQTLPDTDLIVNAASGVLANDSGSGPLQAVLVSDVANGTLTLNLDGSFTYIPDTGFSGSDSFSYRADDGSVFSDPATVMLSVTASGGNEAPVASDDSYQTLPGTELIVNAASGVLANDTDADQDPLQAVLESDVSNGTLTLNPDGSFNYSPDQGFSGTDSFAYKANDGGLDSNLAAVTLSVDTLNSAPRIVSGEVTFTKQVIDTEMDETHAVAAADLDGDGDIDAVATDYIDDSVFWYENDGVGGFVIRLLDGSLDGAYPVGVADVDLDGDTDVLAAGYLADTVVWYENDGSGGFARRVVDAAADGAHSVVAGDMDQDGDNDLLTTNQDADTITWYENDGTNGFTRYTIDNTANGAKRAEFADIDGDGDQDVVSASYFSDEVAWHENDGNQGFTKRIIDPVADGAYYASPADVDGDGDLDVLSANQLNNTIAWYENLGDGSFAPYIIDNSALRARTVIAADIDGDGDVDALSASVNDDTVAWYENDGNGDFTQQVIDTGADGAYGVFAIDMDSDGDMEVFSASRDANAIALHTRVKAHVGMVENGSTLVIESTMLEALDTEDGPLGLIYTVTAGPESGDLLVDGDLVTVAGTFSQNDINNDRLTYVHGGGSTASDSFAFTVEDSTGNVALLSGTFAIVITSSEDTIVQLPLDEGSGTLADDASGQGNDGTLNGAVFETNTGDGSAFSVRFDGTDDFIDLGALNVSGSGLTLAAWFNADSFPGSSDDPRIISKASGVAANDHVFMLGTIRVGSAVRLRARVRVAGVTTTLIASSGDLSTGVWRHAAVTYDGASLRLYLDGVEVGSKALSGAVDVDPNLSVAVGAQPPGAGTRFFVGLLDDIRIYQRALSAAELVTIASGGL